MMAFGFAEVLMLALLSGGMNSTDLVSLIPPRHYFEARNISMSIDKMIDLAIAEPKTPKDQIMQLTALRHLIDETAKFRKDKNYATNREAIEEIARGKRGADPQGFAKDYANRLLMKLDGKKPAAVKTRPIRADALAWFPGDTKFALAADMRQSPQMAANPITELLKLMPDREKQEMYNVIEKVGNVRLERFAFGMVDAAKREEKKVFVRFTGKANPEWLAQAFVSLPFSRMEMKRTKDASGTPIILLQEANRAPIIMLMGSSELAIVAYEGNQGKHGDVMKELLDVRAKKKASATTGVLKDRLAKVPDRAVAFIVGELTEEMKRDFRGGLDPLPLKFTAFVERIQNGMDFQVLGSMANADDADKLVGKIGQLRKDGIAGLKQMMQQPQALPPGFPPVPYQALINTMESLQVQNQKDTVQVRAFVPDGLVQQIGSLGGMMFGGMARGVAPLPPPPPVKIKK